MSVDFFGFTDKGPKRETNEDNFLCLELAPPSGGGRGETVVLLLVADGVGGHQAGDQASTLTVESIKEFFKARLKPPVRASDWSRTLEEAFETANSRIFEKASRDESLTGMGSTLVAALVGGETAYLANVGDSRAYRIHKNRIRQVSLDHSWAEEQRRHQTLSEEEISQSPFKHMITRSLGYEAGVQVDSFKIALEEGDYLLLCSDGLYGILSDGEILRFFRKHKAPEKICRELVGRANRAGSRDNITAIVARYSRRPESRREIPSETISLSKPRDKGWDFE